MKQLVFAAILLLLSGVCFGQSLSDLQKKKQSAEKEIKYTSKLLSQSEKSEKSSLNKLSLLNNKIHQRNKYISAINEEIALYQGFIDDNDLVVEMLKEDVENIKKEYAALVLLASRNRNINDKILFLLSAENFNQAHRRFLYLKKYTSYRHKQAETIVLIQNVLNDKIIKLEEHRHVKQELIGATLDEKKELSKEKTAQNREIQKLKKEQRSLQKKLSRQRRVEQQLEREIQRIIEEEAKKSRAAGGKGFALTPEQKLVGNNFEQNKHRLPWPVERGIITERFGVHTHPLLKNVQIRNNGINISTETGSRVRTIFNGEVTRVFGITGGNTAVIIRHGKYLSVYSNLREVVVKKGDKVSTKQNIGTVYTDREDGNKSILKFQIWRESTKLNPEDWIGK